MNHNFPNMFSPINIGTVTVPNRFVVPPMGNNFANTDGSMSERSAAYYEARAKGGFGLITIESTVVYKEAKGGPRKPCLFSDEVVPSFKRVADACHAYGAKVSIQLQHAGPEGNSKLTGYPLKAASAIAPSAGREIPEAMPTEEVYRLIECYGDAARRAQLAGIDMVEVHCAHGYLVSTFISARTNKRTDEFGGCFENRMRLPRLIIENNRKKTGGNMPILCRINARDEGDGGVDVHDAAAIAAYLEQVCGVDAIHVTRSIHIHDEFMWAPNITHGGFNAELFRFMDRALAAEDETPHIISCSRKASAYLREHSLAYEEFILSDVPDYEETHALCEHLKKLYTTGAVNRVRLIYQSYRNMLSQEPTDRQILPDPESHKTANPDGILYLPSPAAIGARLALTCLNNEVFAAALDNASGAQAATLMAMRSACDSATESAAKLETTINRRRQADVTASVIEIASGNLQQGE